MMKTVHLNMNCIWKIHLPRRAFYADFVRVFHGLLYGYKQPQSNKEGKKIKWLNVNFSLSWIFTINRLDGWGD